MCASAPRSSARGSHSCHSERRQRQAPNLHMDSGLARYASARNDIGMLLNIDPCARPEAGEQSPQRRCLQGDASGGWCKSEPRHVHEHRAASAGDARARVVIDLDNEIVEPVVAPQPVGRASLRHLHRLVVGAVVRVLAPAVVRTDWAHRQAGPWPRRPVGAPPQPPQLETAPRRAAIALALVGPDAAAAKRNRQRKPPRDQPAAAALGGPCAYK